MRYTYRKGELLMLRDEVFIQKPIDEVWDYIVLEYAKSFKCSPSQLEGKEIESVAKAFNNQEVKIKQKVVTLIDNKKIEVVSENAKDKVTTGYELTEDEDGTFLSTYELGEGKDSFLRSLNYKLWTLPVLRNSSKKRLRHRLETIKAIILGEFDENHLSEE